jgi:hypothetical protein
MEQAGYTVRATFEVTFDLPDMPLPDVHIAAGEQVQKLSAGTDFSVTRIEVRLAGEDAPAPLLRSSDAVDVATIRRRMRELGLISSREVKRRMPPNDSVSHTTIARILNGTQTHPSRRVRRNIAVALELPEEALY